jgi:glutamyl-tRNA reductase
MAGRMAILILGVSYRRASIDLLDRLAFTDEDYVKAYRRAEDLDGLRELVILSTCNRVELYADVPSYHAGFLSLKRLLCESRDVDPDALAEPLYSHFEQQAVEHLFSVASGLDSMVLGEQQIHSQVRDALRRADAEGATGRGLKALFHSAARAGRRVRTETTLGAAPDALVEEAVAIASRELGGLEGRAVVVIGAGQMSAITVKHVRRRGAGPVRILNRNVDRARVLAERTSADHGGLAALHDSLAEADLVVSATGAAGIVVHEGTVRRAIELGGRGQQRPLVLLDLAVPRDVDPDAASLPGVHIIDIETLKRWLADRDAVGAAETARANAIIEEEVRRFAIRRRSDRLAPVIRALRERGDAVMAGELERFGTHLSDLTPDEREAVESLARGIVSKLLHDPIVQLKERSGPGTEGAYVRMLAELFDVDPGSAE